MFLGAALLGVVFGILAAVSDDGDDGDSTTGGGGPVPQQSGDLGGGGGQASAGGDIEQFGASLADALDRQDTDTLYGLACADADSSVAESIELLDQTEGAELVSTDQASSGEYLVAVDIYAEGSPMPYVMTVVDQGGGLCVQDVIG